VRTALAVAVAAAGIAIAGCGGGGGGGGSSASAALARFAPADAVAFGQVAVRPQGGLKDSIDAILERFPGGQDAGQKLIQSLDRSLAKDKLSYAQNIEPWLGEHLGGFVTRLRINGQGEPAVAKGDAAVVAEVTDEGRASQELLAAAKADGRVRELTYKGIRIEEQVTGKSPATFAVFDGVAVVGPSPAAVRPAIDAADGDNLSGNAALNDFLDQRQGDNMAVGYLDSAAVLNAAKRSGALSAAQLDSLQSTYGAASGQPLLAALDVESSKVTVDLSSGSGTGHGISPEESKLLDSVPGGAWAVLGLGSVGGFVDQLTAQLRSAGVPGFSAAGFDRQLRRQLGISLDDLRSLGDVAVFASGESVLELQVGAVIEAPPGPGRDRLLAALRRAVLRNGQARIGTLEVPDAEGFSAVPSGFPAPINFATRDDRLVIAVGNSATEALLGGGGGSDAVDSARQELGGDFAVSFALEVQPILNLVENSGGGNDPGFAQARRYLDQISSVAAGGRVDGDRSLFRIVVQLSG
jgi:hypothetical protein